MFIPKQIAISTACDLLKKETGFDWFAEIKIAVQHREINSTSFPIGVRVRHGNEVVTITDLSYTDIKPDAINLDTIIDTDSFKDYLKSKHGYALNGILLEPQTIQQQREQILSKLLAELKAKQPDINLQSLPFSRADMLKMLEEYELFNGLSDSQFDKFFKDQKLCKLRRCRPIK